MSALLATGALLAGGWLAGRAAKEPSGRTVPELVAKGDVALVVPPGWRRLHPGPEVPGFPRDEQIAIGRGDGAAVAAMTKPGRSGVLPDELASPAGAREELVRLGDVEALRFSAMRRAGGDASMTVYAFRTTAGTAALACLGAAADSSTCARLAGTLRLAAEPLPVQPDPRYGAAVEQAFRSLNQRRHRGRVELRSATTRAQQSDAAALIADAYSTAADRLRVVPGRRMVADQNLAIVRGLEAAARAYGALARSAARGDVSAYRSARGRAVAAERIVAQALRRLDAAGYRIR